MLGHWTRWEPVEGLAMKYYIDSVSDAKNGFEIIFSKPNDKNKVRVLFQDNIDSYIKTDESYRLSVIHELGKKYGKNFYGYWTFFKVENSGYLQWLSEQSYGLSNYRPLLHFSFVTADSILDVIAAYEPVIEIVNT